jgi:translation initiation factor 3 subunit F
MTNNQMKIATYISRSLTLGDKQLATEFIEVPCQTRMIEAERIGVDLLDKKDQKSIPGDMERLEQSFTSLADMLDTCKSYVDDVLVSDPLPENQPSNRCVTFMHPFGRDAR